MAKHGETPTRKCIDCGLHSEDLSLFSRSPNAKYGRRNLCYPCYTKRNKENSKLKDWKTDHQTKKRYGVSAEEYKKRMSESTSCFLCGSENELCYDHCHSSMKFRGVLCRKCNTGLGLFKDNPELLRKAADYVERHGETH
jgi:hypothetical protein